MTDLTHGKAHQRRVSRRFPRSLVWLAGIVSIAATVALAATTVNWPGASDAHLVFAGGTPQPPFFQVKIDGGRHFFYVTSRPLFRNKGSKSGAIQKVNIEPVGLKQPPRDLEILRLDKSAIEPSQTKEIRCEFVAVIDSAALNAKTPLEFRIHFYGPGDQEVYWEGITIENLEPRHSPPGHGSANEANIEGALPQPIEV
jgi:hypothetical protein